MMVHLYNGVLLSNAEEWTSDSWKITVQPQMHYANWKNPVSKAIYYIDFINITFWKRQNDRGEQISGC